MTTAVSGHGNTAHSSAQPLRLRFGLSVAIGQASEEREKIIEADVKQLREVATLSKRFMANIMAKGNADWGKTFDIDFGLMNELLIETDKALAIDDEMAKE